MTLFGLLKQVAKEQGITETVCCVCGKRHSIDGTGFFWVLGNIHLGVTTSLIGDNFAPALDDQENLNVIKGSVYCRGESYETSCLRQALKFAYPENRKDKFDKFLEEVK